MKKYSLLFLLIINAFSTYANGDCSCSDLNALKAQAKDKVVLAQRLLLSKNEICKAKGDEILAKNFISTGKLDSAVLYLDKAKAIYTQQGCDDTVKIDLYEFYANVFYSKGNFGKAQEYSLKALKAAEAAGNYSEQATCNTMIAQLFNQTNQATIGINYTRKATQLLSKINNLIEKRDVMYLISKRYLWHYQDTKVESSLDTSGILSWQLLSLARATNSPAYAAKAFNSLQGVEYEKGNWKKALAYLDSSFRYITPDNIVDLQLYFSDKADILIEQKDYTTALQLADTAIALIKRFNMPAYTAEYYQLKSKIANLKGDYKLALDYTLMSKALNDSIRNAEQTKEVAELEKKYNQEKNERKIHELAQEKQIFLLMAIAALMAVAAIAFYLRQQKLKHKKDILETEQRLNRARMNPHFFFNALTSLQTIAMRDNDGKAMASNLSKFSHIMIETLESTYKEYVTIEQEIDFLTEYLELQRMRFPNKFNFQISMHDDTEPHELLIPAMILQPFIENSIEHGFSGISYTGVVNVYFEKQEHDIAITITDNGTGFKEKMQEKGGHISRASQIIKDRIYLLNIKLKTKARFSIENASTGTGVEVKIYLPILYKD